eukprot:11774044-Alexandrium_andersonii.AAC.1
MLAAELPDPAEGTRVGRLAARKCIELAATDGAVSRLPVRGTLIGVFNAERPGDPSCSFLLDEVGGQT